jgi:hypothetical protein
MYSTSKSSVHLAVDSQRPQVWHQLELHAIRFVVLGSSGLSENDGEGGRHNEPRESRGSVRDHSFLGGRFLGPLCAHRLDRLGQLVEKLAQYALPPPGHRSASGAGSTMGGNLPPVGDRRARAGDR